MKNIQRFFGALFVIGFVCSGGWLRRRITCRRAAVTTIVRAGAVAVDEADREQQGDLFEGAGDTL